jgi:ankyrin repeat protein
MSGARIDPIGVKSHDIEYVLVYTNIEVASGILAQVKLSDANYTFVMRLHCSQHWYSARDSRRSKVEDSDDPMSFATEFEVELECLPASPGPLRCDALSNWSSLDFVSAMRFELYPIPVVRAHKRLMAAFSEGTELALNGGVRPENWPMTAGPTSCLAHAAWQGHIRTVATLINSGAEDIDGMDSNLRTPLDWATEADQWDIVKLLVERGAQIEARYGRGRVCSSFRTACRLGRLSIVRYFLSNAMKPRLDASSPEDHDAPLKWAIRRGDLELVKVLLDAGANPHIKHQLAQQGQQHKLNLDRAEYSHAALTRYRSDRRRPSEGSALHWAAQFRQDAISKLLLDKNVAVDAPENGGMARTPLQRACQSGAAGIVRLLLKQGADQEYEDAWGYTAMGVAVFHDHENVIEILLDNGADPTQRTTVPMLWAIALVATWMRRRPPYPSWPRPKPFGMPPRRFHEAKRPPSQRMGTALIPGTVSTDSSGDETDIFYH